MLDHAVLQEVIRDIPIAKETPHNTHVEQKGYISQVTALV